MKKVGIKINLSWIICGVLVFFVVRNFFNSDTNVNISNKVFNVLLSNGWVDKVVCVRNTGVVQPPAAQDDGRERGGGLFGPPVLRLHFRCRILRV